MWSWGLLDDPDRVNDLGEGMRFSDIEEVREPMPIDKSACKLN